MKIDVVQVTPQLAREWLKRNSKNRAIRPSHVENLRLAFERGEYTMTHQGIAFGDDGELIDGQHRLSAIAALRDGAFPFLVSGGWNRGEVFTKVDTSAAIRNVADVLGHGRDVSTTATFLARLYNGRSNGVTPTYVAPFVTRIEPVHAELLAFCGTSAKTWSSAPVRAAAVTSIMAGVDGDYVKLLYRALVLAEFSVMPPAAQALYRSHMAGKVRASAATDIFCRCLKVFDPKNAGLGKVQINEPAKLISSVRELLDFEVFGCLKSEPKKSEPKKKAPAVSRGAKGVSGFNYLTARG